MDISTLNRADFLKLFGAGAAGLLATACLGGCGGSDSSPTPPSNVDFTVDLTSAAAADLNNASTGYIYGDGGQIIVAKTTAGAYLAFQALCPHEGATVTYMENAGRFFCPRHSSYWDNTGNKLTGPAPTGLKMYTVTQTGNSLRITG